MQAQLQLLLNKFVIPEILFFCTVSLQIDYGYGRPKLYDENLMYNKLSATSCGHGKIVSGGGARHPQMGRVLNGDEAQFGEFPWITSIQSSAGQHFCAGFMVGSRFLISAAHCFRKRFNPQIKYNEDKSVILDSLQVAVSRVKLSDKDEPSQILKVKRLVVHPEFDEKELNHDIAVLELQSDMQWSDGLSPICLPEVENEDHGQGDVTVAGWGYRQCGPSNISNELHKITVPLWTADDCKKSYEDADYKFNRLYYVCAGGEHKEISRGDSGGPLMFKNPEGRWTAIGIVSSGKFMCSDRVPGVYTKVSNYLKFLKKEIA